MGNGTPALRAWKGTAHDAMRAAACLMHHMQKGADLAPFGDPKSCRMGLAPPFLFAEALCVDVRYIFEIVHSAVESFFGIFMIRRPGPIFNMPNQTMFDRIIMDAIDVALQQP